MQVPLVEAVLKPTFGSGTNPSLNNAFSPSSPSVRRRDGKQLSPLPRTASAARLLASSTGSGDSSVLRVSRSAEAGGGPGSGSALLDDSSMEYVQASGSFSSSLWVGSQIGDGTGSLVEASSVTVAPLSSVESSTVSRLYVQSPSLPLSHSVTAASKAKLARLPSMSASLMQAGKL
jgi:hypothetical protein